MYMQKKTYKENKNNLIASSTSQRKGDFQHGINLIDNRASLNSNAVPTQRMPVTQLATRRSRPVRFNGSAFQLEQLILQWGPPQGTQVVATQTDNVGGMYTVRFTNRNGPAMSIDTADGWVQNGIAHANDAEESSSSEEEFSD